MLNELAELAIELFNASMMSLGIMILCGIPVAIFWGFLSLLKYLGV